jgi:hypothetical protein
MQMKKALLTLGIGLGLGSSTLFAQTAIRQLDADTLLVELQHGKPPHGRMLIEREQDPAVFAAFDAMRTQPKRNLFAGFFGGAPGKGNYPQPVRSLEAPNRETTEFAQFEESTDTDGGRVEHWHGAPGKGLPLK